MISNPTESSFLEKLKRKRLLNIFQLKKLNMGTSLIFLFVIIGCMALAGLVFGVWTFFFRPEKEPVIYPYGSVDVASTAPTLHTYSNPLVIDEVTVASDARVLLKDELNPQLNGIYIYNGDTLTPSRDMSEAAQIVEGIPVLVKNGTSNATGSFVARKLKTGDDCTHAITGCGVVFDNYVSYLLG